MDRGHTQGFTDKPIRVFDVVATTRVAGPINRYPLYRLGEGGTELSRWGGREEEEGRRTAATKRANTQKKKKS